MLTPQILYKSLELHEAGSAEHRLPAMGRYLTEQPMAFCQVLWRTDIVVDKFLPRADHDARFDPIPINPEDPDPNVLSLPAPFTQRVLYTMDRGGPLLHLFDRILDARFMDTL